MIKTMDDLQSKSDDELREIMRSALPNQYVPSSIYHRARQELAFRSEEAMQQERGLTDMSKIVLKAISESKMGTDITGKFMTIEILEHQFGEKHMSRVKQALTQLVDQDFIEQVEDNDDVFRLTPFGSNYLSEMHTAHITSFSNISNSNIANNSQHVSQTIDISALPEDVQEHIEELRIAAKKRDKSAMKKAFGYIADKAVDVAMAIALGHLKLS